MVGSGEKGVVVKGGVGSLILCNFLVGGFGFFIFVIVLIVYGFLVYVIY